MANVKLYPHPDLVARGGIPVAGEYFSAEDARRLVGQGLATRQAPSPIPHFAGGGRVSKPATTKRSKTPARPVKEG